MNTVLEQMRRPRWRAASTGSVRSAALGALRVVALLGLVAAPFANTARATDADVAIVDFAFEPTSVTIASGDTVTWTVTRAVDPHTVSPVEPAGAFAPSPLLRQGDSFAVTFSEPGAYSYRCTIHPEDMVGLLVVEATLSTTSPTDVATPTLASSPTASPPPTPGTSPVPTPSPADASPSPGGTLPLEAVALVVALGGAIALGATWRLARARRDRDMP